MPVELFAHNESAYRSAAAMLEEHGRAAVIHPTGTGKSFIAFRLAQDEPGARICWLAPSEYIFRSQKENYLEAGGDGEIFARITFLTYSKLMYDAEASGAWEVSDVREASFPYSSPDYIVLDEFHRCGAEGWGRGVDALLGTFPGAKVLGLSATHIRYLDSGRDMALELFGGNVASRMGLGEAIAKGILPAPLYISCFYEYEDELKKVSYRVRSHRNPGVRGEGERLLGKLRRRLRDADGPREV